MCAKDLQIILDFCGTPQIDAVERVKGVEPSFQPWEGCIIAVIRHPQAAFGGNILIFKTRMFEINTELKSAGHLRRQYSNIQNPNVRNKYRNSKFGIANYCAKYVGQFLRFVC